jgi:hypothetical protein
MVASTSVVVALLLGVAAGRQIAATAARGSAAEAGVLMVGLGLVVALLAVVAVVIVAVRRANGATAARLLVGVAIALALGGIAGQATATVF